MSTSTPTKTGGLSTIGSTSQSQGDCSRHSKMYGLTEDRGKSLKSVCAYSAFLVPKEKKAHALILPKSSASDPTSSAHGSASSNASGTSRGILAAPSDTYPQSAGKAPGRGIFLILTPETHNTRAPIGTCITTRDGDATSNDGNVADTAASVGKPLQLN